VEDPLATINLTVMTTDDNVAGNLHIAPRRLEGRAIGTTTTATMPGTKTGVATLRAPHLPADAMVTTTATTETGMGDAAIAMMTTVNVVAGTIPTLAPPRRLHHPGTRTETAAAAL